MYHEPSHDKEKNKNLQTPAIFLLRKMTFGSQVSYSSPSSLRGSSTSDICAIGSMRWTARACARRMRMPATAARDSMAMAPTRGRAHIDTVASFLGWARAAAVSAPSYKRTAAAVVHGFGGAAVVGAGGGGGAGAPVEQGLGLVVVGAAQHCAVVHWRFKQVGVGASLKYPSGQKNDSHVTGGGGGGGGGVGAAVEHGFWKQH